MPETIERNTEQTGADSIERVPISDMGLYKAHHARRDEFEQNNEFSMVGFDTTRFESPREFLVALVEGGIVDFDLAEDELDNGVFYNPTQDSHYAEVWRDDENYNFAWADDEVLLVVSINPFTGLRGQVELDEYNSESVGYPHRVNTCGYIGIEGKTERVDRLTASIKANSTSVKDFDPEHRSYV